ncbi:MAG: translocation/assembly module TamB [Flavobacteriales bacterium]|nr:translocation/assembly module TamB [Flavobacteriales bacterium]
MRRVLLWAFLLPPALVALVVVLVYLPPVQDFIRAKAVVMIEEKIGTPVRLDRFALRFPAGVALDGLLVLDESGDTLLYAGEVEAKLSLSALVDGRIELSGSKLAHVRAVIDQRTDTTFNFTYIIRAFSGNKMKEAVPDSAAPMPFSMTGILLEDVSLDMTLAPSGLGMRVRLGKLDVELDAMDAGATLFHVAGINIADTRVDMRTAPKPSEPDTYPDLKNPFTSLDITLEEMGLQNVAFSLVNTISGDSLWLSVAKGAVTVDSVALARQLMHFASLEMKGARFGTLSRLDTLPRGTETTAPPAWLDQNDGFRYWVRGLDIRLRDATIIDSDFQLHKGSVAKAAELLDPAHMVLTNVALEAEDLVFNDQRVAAVIKRFTATGGNAEKLNAAMRMSATPAELRLEDGVVALSGTEVSFSATATPGDLSTAYRAPKAVPLNGLIIANIDLHLLPALLHQAGVSLPRTINVREVWDTHIAFSGTAQRADTLRVDLIGDQGTIVHLTGQAEDMASILQSSFRADLHEIRLGDGLREILRAYVPPKVPVPDRLAGSVVLTGTQNAMDAAVDLQSDLGDVKGKIGASGLGARMPDALHADLTIANAALGRFAADTAMGALSAHVLVDGQALNTAQRSGRIEVAPTHWRYHGQEFGGSQLMGRAEGDSVHAEVITTAPSLAVVLRADARWPVGSDTISGAVELRVDRLGLKDMGWYKHPLNVQGEWQGTGTYSMDGFVELALEGDSVLLFNNERSFRFEEFSMQGRLASDSTLFVLESDALEVEYHTNVPPDSLMPRTRTKLLSFFRADTTLIPAPGSHMDLRIALPRTEWLTGLVLPGLKAIELKDFSGHYDSDADVFRTTIDLPLLRYEDIALSGLIVGADAKGHALDGSLHVDSVRYNDFHIAGLTATATSGPGTLHTALKIQEEDAPPKYVVPIDFQRAGGEVTVHIGEGLVLDSSTWTADPLNALRFTKAGPMAEHFILTSGDQRAELVTDAASTTVQLERFNMGAFLNIVSTTDSVSLVNGELTGEVVLPLNDRAPLRADLRIHDLMVQGQLLGDLVIDASGTGTNVYDATARFENGTNELDAKLHYDGSRRPPDMEAHADIGLTDLSFLKPFTTSVLYDLGGGLKGSVDWRTYNGSKSVRGDLTFTDAVLGVKRTGARYTLKKERVLADATGFTFNDFTVLDSLGNAFVLHGQVLTTDLSSMRFDLGLRTDSFQLVNSAAAKDALFYGDLFASADVRITGTDREPIVKGELGILAGTDLSVVLPGSEVRLVASEGIVEFTTDLAGTDTSRTATDEERLRDSLRAHLPKIDLDLRIRVDDRASFAIVLDPVTGDQATFRGDGDLRFRYDPNGRMYLNGPFTIREGGYTLEFYGLVKKRFDLVSGSQVVWEGDPVAARMDIKARYMSQSAAYPLVANANGGLGEAERNRLAARLPFEVIINIDGAMKKPDITFGIDLPREYRNSYPQVNDELDRLADRSREEERNRQVFGLLVLNSFIQDEGAGGAPSSRLATSAARNSVNGILTDQMNKITGRYMKGVDVQLGVSTVDQAQGSSTYQRTSVDYKVSKSFLDKRLSFEVGGSVGVDEQDVSTSNVSSTRAAQYAIVYDLTRDGRFRLRGFYQNAFDLYDGEITDSGIAIMNTRDFEENEKAREAARELIRQQQALERKRRKGERAKDDDARPSAPTDPSAP